MRTVGIVAEYNPFHNGHLYHLEKSKEKTGAEISVAVMSGNFVQRGEPAIFDKWIRAEMAVRNGVDLVFELPFCYAANNAENFAKGAIRLLDALGCIDAVSFGSEEGELDKLETAAALAADESVEFRQALKEGLDTGYSYPKARADAMAKFIDGDTSFLKNSNNILAIEYLKQLKLLKSDMRALTVKRSGEDYLSDKLPKNGQKVPSGTPEFASATGIRKKMLESIDLSVIEDFVPAQTTLVLKEINNCVKSMLNDFKDILTYEVLKKGPQEIAEIYAAAEGLENKLKAAVRDAESIDDIVSSVVSKRYTETRIKRMLIQTIMGMTKKDFESIDESQAMYGRILGFSAKGAKLIKEIKKSDKCTIPIITNINKETPETEAQRKLMAYDILASDIYNLAAKKNVYSNSDYVIMPYIGK